ncbi:hypothetical protein V500_11346 [Pseudogymnoascus sp. VKM F-4518 (FW-2643)]|nr:hypothetical protein V500_11346 [Pseudogymnoascus sp. VKM F-4518 (FW-2643)]
MEVVIIGAGPSGIAIAHSLKQKLGFNKFTIYEKLDGPGGTWRTNTYPGCGCDIPSHLYSFSFNLNPDWSKELCDQPEILEYMEATVDKFNLRPHMRFMTKCLGAQWISKTKKWEIELQDMTGRKFTKEADIFISAVGGISEPRDVKFPGMEKFQGPIFHTARWDHSYNYEGKRMAVIGNGCSAAQVVPNVVHKVEYLKQFARSPQWYHERPNREFSKLEKFCFRYIPLWQRYHRLSLFTGNDALVETYGAGEKAQRVRTATENGARNYIYQNAPEKYHHFIVPEFPLGCKRRIFDPDYLAALHEESMSLVDEGIREINEAGITSERGTYEEFDVIVLATGFKVSEFLAPMKIVGREGKELSEQWKESDGAQAYYGTYVHNFPNFAILFGPNSFPAHNSVIFATEVQAEFIVKSLFTPIMNNRASIIEVRQEAEDNFTAGVQALLNGTVFSANCSNWYINSKGKNSASWPGFQARRWLHTLVAEEYCAMDVYGILQHVALSAYNNISTGLWAYQEGANSTRYRQACGTGTGTMTDIFA